MQGTSNIYDFWENTCNSCGNVLQLPHVNKKERESYVHASGRNAPASQRSRLDVYHPRAERQRLSVRSQMGTQGALHLISRKFAAIEARGGLAEDQCQQSLITACKNASGPRLSLLLDRDPVGRIELSSSRRLHSIGCNSIALCAYYT